MAEDARWYVIHTYSGYENAVAAAIMKAAENRRMQDLIQEVNIPMETVLICAFLKYSISFFRMSGLSSHCSGL